MRFQFPLLQSRWQTVPKSGLLQHETSLSAALALVADRRHVGYVYSWDILHRDPEFLYMYRNTFPHEANNLEGGSLTYRKNSEAIRELVLACCGRGVEFLTVDELQHSATIHLSALVLVHR